MRVLVPTTILPHQHHTIRAFNVVLYELLYSLSAQPSLEIALLPVSIGHAHQLSDDESSGLETLSAVGVSILPPLVLPAITRPHILKLLFSPTKFFYPITISKDLLKPVLHSLMPDAIMTVWSEPLTALFADVKIPKIAYYGNPDPKSSRAQASYAFRNGGTLISYFKSLFFNALLESAHLRLMNKWSKVANVASNDAEYYCKKGHPDAFYIQNVWTERTKAASPAPVRRYPESVKIAASIGKLNGTANTFGFEYLRDKLLPEMRNTFRELPFELHIFGALEPNQHVADLFLEKEVIKRGFVDDIDYELSDCSSFLCINNATEYNVGHTRYLHAWSLGCCVVAHANVRHAMPEVIHERNALLGSTPKEISAHLFAVASDPVLRGKISAGGLLTFKQYFTAKKVSTKLAVHLHGLMNSSLPKLP
jgi:hypothetical protein